MLVVGNVMVICLAAVNAGVITWATVIDDRHSSALARALGVAPREVGAGLATAQVLPALAGAVLGIFPGSVALFAAINPINDDDNHAALPPLWQLVTVVLATVLAVAALTAVPARLGARRPAP